MKSQIRPMLCVILITAGVAPALASDASDAALRQLETRFHAADRNGDGKLSREEARTGMPHVYDRFDQLDGSKKGYITLADIKTAVAAMR